MQSTNGRNNASSISKSLGRQSHDWEVKVRDQLCCLKIHNSPLIMATQTQSLSLRIFLERESETEEHNHPGVRSLWHTGCTLATFRHIRQTIVILRSSLFLLHRVRHLSCSEPLSDSLSPALESGSLPSFSARRSSFFICLYEALCGARRRIKASPALGSNCDN